jgi:hypothetical protein
MDLVSDLGRIGAALLRGALRAFDCALQCVRAIRRSSTFFPDLSCAAIQSGSLPPLWIAIFWMYFWVGSTRPLTAFVATLQLSQTALKFVLFSVQLLRQDRAEFFVQDPKIVGGHCGWVFHVRFPACVFAAVK